MDSYRPLEELDEWPRKPQINASDPIILKGIDEESFSDTQFLGDISKLGTTSRFDRQYLKLGKNFIPEKKRIDYVLVHPHITDKMKKEMESEDLKKENKKEKLREIFENRLRKEGFFIQKEVIGKNCYKKLHCPFKKLCYEAEKVNMEMPLEGV